MGRFVFFNLRPLLTIGLSFLGSFGSSFVSRFLRDRRDALRQQRLSFFLSPFCPRWLFFPLNGAAESAVPSVLHHDRSVFEACMCPRAGQRAFLETPQVSTAPSEGGGKKIRKERERTSDNTESNTTGNETELRRRAHRRTVYTATAENAHNGNYNAKKEGTFGHPKPCFT